MASVRKSIRLAAEAKERELSSSSQSPNAKRSRQNRINRATGQNRSSRTISADRSRQDRFELDSSDGRNTDGNVNFAPPNATDALTLEGAKLSFPSEPAIEAQSVRGNGPETEDKDRSEGKESRSSYEQLQGKSEYAGFRRFQFLNACNLSHFVEKACKRLKTRPRCRDTHAVCDLISRSFANPQTPAACILLVGPRLSGKSAFVDSVLDMLVERSMDFDANGLSDPAPVCVRLNGLVHTKVHSATRAIASALREASRFPVDAQESVDMIAQGDGKLSPECNGSGAIGDMESTIDAIAGTPAVGSISIEEDNDPDSINVSECNWEIANAIRIIKEQARGILFILDDFDLFAQAGTAQPVLYNILNILQDSELRGAFIGMTTHIDATDGLEKRIKSRFLPREVVISLPKSVDEVLLHITNAVDLCLEDERGDQAAAEEFNKVVGQFVKSAEFQKVLAEQILRDRSVGRITVALCETLSAILPFQKGTELSLLFPTDDDVGTGLSVEDFRSSLGISNTTLQVLEGLSVLEITLLVALGKLENRRGASDVEYKFDDVYAEYVLIKSGGFKGYVESDGEPVAEKQVAVKAWSRLVDSALVERTGRGPVQNRAVYLAVDADDLNLALERHSGASAFIKRWGKGIVS